MVLSSAIVCDHDRRIADDRRPYCDLRSAIRDHMETSLNEETADHFHKIINNVHPDLKFEIEKPQTTPNGQSLSLLDFKVTISQDGNSSVEFYKKPAKKPLFVHYQSVGGDRGVRTSRLPYLCLPPPALFRVSPVPE